MPGVQEDIPERLHVDPRRARRVAENAFRFAKSLDGPSLEGASARLLAASCWSLVNVEHAAHAFEEAAADYSDLQRTYGLVLTICAVSEAAPPDQGPEDEVGDGPPPEPVLEDWLHILLGAHWAAARGVGADAEEASRHAFGRLTEDQALTMAPVGRLGLPLRQYLLLANALATAAAFGDREAAARTIADDLMRFLERAQEPYAAAMADRYHWERLQSALLPVEPELLAVSVLASATARRLGLPPLTRTITREPSPFEAAFLMLGELFVLERWGQ